jgi:hypothetical protein
VLQHGKKSLTGTKWNTRTKPGGNWPAEIVHAVHVESLREFATIMTTDEVLRDLEGEESEEQKQI